MKRLERFYGKFSPFIDKTDMVLVINGNKILFNAILDNKRRQVRHLLITERENMQRDHEGVYLTHACINEHTSLIKLLLVVGVDVGGHINDADIPNWCSKKGQTQNVRLLLVAGADTNIRYLYGIISPSLMGPVAD